MCFQMEGGSPLENVLPTELMKFVFYSFISAYLSVFKNLLQKQVLVIVNLLFSLSLSSNQKEQMQPASKSAFSKPRLKNETVLVRYINSIINPPIILPTIFTSKNQSKLQISFGTVKTVQILDTYCRSKRYLMSFLKI